MRTSKNKTDKSSKNKNSKSFFSKVEGNDFFASSKEKTFSSPPPIQTKSIESKLQESQGSGKSMEKDTRSGMEQAFGTDFSKVKIHTGSAAIQMNRSLSAKAFTSNNDIYFNKGEYNPNTKAGKKLLAHELSHTIQQKSMNHTTIQRFGVDDVFDEMKGKAFELVDDFGGIKKGTKIIIADWKGNASQAYGYYNKEGKKIYTSIEKYLLKPVFSKTAGLTKYEVGLDKQRSTVKKSQLKLEEWKKQEAKYKRNRKTWEAELKRLEDLHTKRESTMSRMLIRETMYNRFDADIVKWVDHYNTLNAPKTKLQYKVVKSILFQETRMGTSGQHLKKPPYEYNGIKSQYNLGQVIDSSGPQQYLMIKEMAPSIYKKYGFDKFEKKAKWKGMSGAEWWGNEKFTKAIKEFSEWKDKGGDSLMGNKKDLYLDYEFWIRATVKWLFYKYARTKDWSKAVKAFNGRGSAAENYKKKVLERASKGDATFVGNN